MCNTGKIHNAISLRLQPASQKKRKPSATFSVSVFRLCDTSYRRKALASKFSLLCLWRRKFLLRSSFVLCVKAQDDLLRWAGQMYCFEGKLHQHLAFCLFLRMTCTSWLWRAESAGGTGPQMNSWGTSGLSFLAALSEESILFITDQWGAEEWLAKSATGQALNFYLSADKSSKINKHNNQPPDKQPAFLYSLTL